MKSDLLYFEEQLDAANFFKAYSSGRIVICKKLPGLDIGYYVPSFQARLDHSKTWCRCPDDNSSTSEHGSINSGHSSTTSEHSNSNNATAEHNTTTTAEDNDNKAIERTLVRLTEPKNCTWSQV